jgi:DNA topoisomerase-1
VHPLVINLYENNTIKKYLDELEQIEENDGKAGLTQEEKLVLKILENEKM